MKVGIKLKNIILTILGIIGLQALDLFAPVDLPDQPQMAKPRPKPNIFKRLGTGIKKVGTGIKRIPQKITRGLGIGKIPKQQILISEQLQARLATLQGKPSSAAAGPAEAGAPGVPARPSAVLEMTDEAYGELLGEVLAPRAPRVPARPAGIAAGTGGRPPLELPTIDFSEIEATEPILGAAARLRGAHNFEGFIGKLEKGKPQVIKGFYAWEKAPDDLVVDFQGKRLIVTHETSPNPSQQKVGTKINPSDRVFFVKDLETGITRHLKRQGSELFELYELPSQKSQWVKVSSKDQKAFEKGLKRTQLARIKNKGWWGRMDPGMKLFLSFSVFGTVTGTIGTILGFTQPLWMKQDMPDPFPTVANLLEGLSEEGGHCLITLLQNMKPPMDQVQGLTILAQLGFSAKQVENLCKNNPSQLTALLSSNQGQSGIPADLGLSQIDESSIAGLTDEQLATMSDEELEALLGSLGGTPQTMPTPTPSPAPTSIPKPVPVPAPAPAPSPTDIDPFAGMSTEELQELLQSLEQEQPRPIAPKLRTQ